MIKVQDWIASIPDEEKHIAYVGEGISETREFLLCGDGWERYKDWSFHLDMAFDPESITTRDSRQVVQTRVSTSEMTEEAAVNTDETVTKETYTVYNEDVLDYNLTDISSLVKTVGEEGIRLVWTVLRQHTLLPGKLWATLRAVDSTAQKVKKSAIMVFEVDAAICAVPAARPAISEMEQIEARVAAAADAATYSADRAETAVEKSLQNVYMAQDAAASAATHMRKAEQYYTLAAACVEATETARDEAVECVDTVTEICEQAQRYADDAAANASEAERLHGLSAGYANTAVMASSAAQESAADAASSAAACRRDATQAVDKCSRYVVQCENAVTEAQSVVRAVEGFAYRRINVRDYGAVGDGVKDDRAAILAAFDAAKSQLPCEVYFPAGTYGISNGITVEMAYGTGGLRVCGAGRDVVTIKYLDSYNPNQAGNMWYAIRIWPVGMPNIKPTNEDDYLHDISYTGLTVYDPDPIAHAWNTVKGDPAKEETHGFDIHYCKRVSVTDCTIIDVGDEAIDICACHDVVVMNNHLVGCPAAGTAGGAISIGDGCKGVVVSGNTVNGSAADETLEDGAVLSKRNFGIAVESLYVPVYDVIITGNTIKDVHGNGINMGATTAGSGIYRVSVSGNVITGCCNGIRIMDTTNPKCDISIVDNQIVDCGGDLATDGYGIITGSQTYNLLVSGNTIKNIVGEQQAARIVVADHALMTDNVFQDVAGYALLTGGDVVVRNCLFHNIGTGGTATQAIQKMDSTAYKLTIAGCRLKEIHCTVGIRNADVVENTDIELVNGGSAIVSKYLTCVIGGHFNGILTLSKDGAVMQGVTIEASNAGNHAVTIAANGVSVTGCRIDVGTAKRAITENDGCMGNLVANNIVNGKLSTAAVLILADNAGTVCVNNIDLRQVIA